MPRLRVLFTVIAPLALLSCASATPPPPRCSGSVATDGRRIPSALRKQVPAVKPGPGWRLTFQSRDGLARWWSSWTGLSLRGRSAIEVNLTAPDGDLSRASGRIRLTCQGCATGPILIRQTWAFTMPGVELGAIDLQIQVKGGVVVFDRVTTSSDDLKLSLTGEVALRNPVSRSRVQAELRVTLSHALKQREPKFALVESAFARNKQADGSLRFKLQGRLDRLTLAPRRLSVTVPTAPKQPTSSTPLPTRPQPRVAPPVGKLRLAKKVGHRSYRIYRKGLDALLLNTTLLARQARIVPYFKDGQPLGFKLYAIRPGSAYSQLGLHSGDAVLRINNMTIRTPDKALEVYTKLRSAKKLQFLLERQGKPITLKYVIR